MSKKSFKFRFVFFILYSVLLAVIYLFYFDLDRVVQSLSTIRRVPQIISTPFEVFFSSFSSNFHQQMENYDKVKELTEKIGNLQLELLRYKKLEKELEASNREKEDLQKALEYKQSIDFDVILAKIIYKDTQNLFKTIILDKGYDDGVVPGQIIVSFLNNDYSLIGKITSAEKHSSRVMTLTDNLFRVGGSVDNANYGAIVEGQANVSTNMILSYLDRHLENPVGKTVYTSSFGGSYPEGIPIGKIVEVQSKESIYQTVVVEPFSNFFNVRYVYILKSYEANQEKEKK